MQQAYRALRVIAEAQTIRIVLPANPDELALQEVCMACTLPAPESWSGIKAVVLEFTGEAGRGNGEEVSPASFKKACLALHTLEQPVLAVLRSGTLSAIASQLIQEADLVLMAEEAYLSLKGQDKQPELLSGTEAARLKYVTWTTPTANLKDEMGRILDMLRGNSAIALRHAKTSVRIGMQPGEQGSSGESRLERLRKVNAFYLQQAAQTVDAQEGLRAFLEKRKVEWKNQ